jgi:hypothetical protein
MLNMFSRGGYGRISVGLRVLELAADSRETTPGKGALLVDHHVDVERTQRGGGEKLHDTNNGLKGGRDVARHQQQEECRGGRSGEVWRRRSSRSAAAGKPYTEGFDYCSHPRGLLNTAIAVMPTLPIPTIARHT